MTPSDVNWSQQFQHVHCLQWTQHWNTLFLSKRDRQQSYPSKCWEEADFYPSSPLPSREPFQIGYVFAEAFGQGSICACCSHTSPQRNPSLWNNFPKCQNTKHWAVHPPGLLLPKSFPTTAAGRWKQSDRLGRDVWTTTLKSGTEPRQQSWQPALDAQFTWETEKTTKEINFSFPSNIKTTKTCWRLKEKKKKQNFSKSKQPLKNRYQVLI